MFARSTDSPNSVLLSSSRGLADAFRTSDKTEYDHNLELGLLADRMLEAVRRFERHDPRPRDVEAAEKARDFLDVILNLRDTDVQGMLDRSLADEQLGSYSVPLTHAFQFIPQASDDVFSRISSLKEDLDVAIEDNGLDEEDAADIAEFFRRISKAALADDAKNWGMTISP